jgi:hypothetical protein
MASTIGSTIQKKEVGVSPPPQFGIISSASPFNEGFSSNNIFFIQVSGVDGGGDFI